MVVTLERYLAISRPMKYHIQVSNKKCQFLEKKLGVLVLLKTNYFITKHTSFFLVNFIFCQRYPSRGFQNGRNLPLMLCLFSYVLLSSKSQTFLVSKHLMDTLLSAQHYYFQEEPPGLLMRMESFLCFF